MQKTLSAISRSHSAGIKLTHEQTLISLYFEALRRSNLIAERTDFAGQAPSFGWRCRVRGRALRNRGPALKFIWLACVCAVFVMVLINVWLNKTLPPDSWKLLPE